MGSATIPEFSSVNFTPCLHNHSSPLVLDYVARKCKNITTVKRFDGVWQGHTNAARLWLAVNSLVDFPELPVSIDYRDWALIGSWIFPLRIKISSCPPAWDAPCWPTCWVWCEMCVQTLWPSYPPERHACRAGCTHQAHLFISAYPVPTRGLSHLCFQLLFFISLH